MQLNNRRQQAGVSLVETMVGIVVGLFIASGMIFFTVNFTGENRRLLLEARLHQDLRAAMDIVTRDLRRAGYWGAAELGAWYFGNTTGVVAYSSTGYGDITPTNAAATETTFAYALSDTNNSADAAEQFGFRLNGTTLQMRTGGAATWTDLTDPRTTSVTAFTVTPQITQININCPTTCISNCPVLRIRDYEISITAVAIHDSTVVRTMASSVRVRNDDGAGVCP